MPGTRHCGFAQVRRSHLVAKFCEPNGLGSDPASAIEDFERLDRVLCIQETVKNFRLTVNRPVPVLEEEVVTGGK